MPDLVFEGRRLGSLEGGVWTQSIRPPGGLILVPKDAWAVLRGTRGYERKKYPCHTLRFESPTGQTYVIDKARAVQHGKSKAHKGWEVPTEYFDIEEDGEIVHHGRRILTMAPAKATTGSPILSLEELEAFVQEVLTQPAFVYDVETYGELRGVPTKNDVLWISIATQGVCRTVNMGYQYEDGPACLPIEATWAVLEPLLYSDRLKIGANIKFDLQSVAKYYDDRIPPGPYFDVLSACALLNENQDLHIGLKDLVYRTFDLRYEALAKKAGIEEYSYVEAALYAYLDSKFTWLLYLLLAPALEADRLDTVWELEMDVLGVVAHMEYLGVHINESLLRRMEEEVRLQMAEVEQAIYGMVGFEFDLNSVDDKGKVIYGHLGHTPRHFTEKTNRPSTKDEHLMQFKSDPVVARMADYGDLKKLHSTYLEGLLKHLGSDGIVHGNLQQLGTVTGRFSAARPNLQNIPAREDVDALGTGDKVRALYVAPKGQVFIDADFSQIEYRILGHYSKAKLLLEGYAAGHDSHTLTAAAAFGIDPKDVTKDQRQAGKGLNFAMVYGAGPDKVASLIGCSVKQGQELLDSVKAGLPEVEVLNRAVISKARRRRPPYVQTVLGRKRRIWDLLSSDFKTRSRAERQAFNALIQGSAADAMKVAMINTSLALAETNAHMVLTVHDELLIECPEAEAKETLPIVVAAMEAASSLFTIPLVVEAKIGDTWASAK